MATSTKRLCLIFSIGSLVSLAAHIASILLCDTTVSLHAMQQNLLYAALAGVPFAELFAFMLAEDKLRINKRFAVGGIFLTYLVQILLFYVFFRDLAAPTFVSSVLNRNEIAVELVNALRMVFALTIWFTHRWCVKLFSIGMAVYTGLSFVLLIGNIDWLGGHFFCYVFAVLADLMFHIALFYVADYLNRENNWIFYETALEKWLYRIHDEEEDEEWEREPQEERSLADDYKLIRIYAAGGLQQEFVATDRFFRHLSLGVMWNRQGRYYTKEDYIKHLQRLKQMAEEINAMLPGYISDCFINMLENLLNDRDHYLFEGYVVSAARLFWDDSSTWQHTFGLHEEYLENGPRK